LSQTFEQEARLVDYLLGRLPQAERMEIDSRLFTEDDFNDELLATLDDLVHAYLAGALSQEDRARFEAEILSSPRHRQRLVFMKELLSAVHRSPEEAVPLRPWLLVAAAAVLAAVGTLIALGPRTGERPMDRAAVSTPAPVSASAPPQAEPSPLPRPSAEASAVRRVRLPAPPASAVDLALTSQTRTVRLELDVREERPGFDAVIRTADGTPIWRARGIPPPEPGRPLVLAVPATLLGSGRYRLRVEGESLRDSIQPSPLVFEYDLRVTRAP